MVRSGVDLSGAPAELLAQMRTGMRQKCSARDRDARARPRGGNAFRTGQLLLLKRPSGHVDRQGSSYFSSRAR
jgi:hypothetical protein